MENLIESIIPQYLRLLHDIAPNRLDKYVKSDWNIDEIHNSELVVLFSYYEAFEPNERNNIRNVINSITLEEILSIILENNPVLFEAIESMNDRGIPVIDWLNKQITRTHVMIEVFDNLIEEGKKYTCT